MVNFMVTAMVIGASLGMGLVIGVIAMVAMAVRREDKQVLPDPSGARGRGPRSPAADRRRPA